MFIELVGERVMQRKLTHTAATRANMRQILRGPIADIIFEIEEQIFNSEGRRGGGSWVRDSAAWTRYKLKHGLDPRVGHASLALRRAMTERGAAHQRLTVTSQSLRLGVSLPYAQTQQEHRPYVKITPLDRQEIGAVIKQQLIAAFRGVG